MRFRIHERRINNPRDVKDILSSVLEEMGAAEQVSFEKIRESWQDIAGHIIATHTIPEKVVNDVLYLSVDHSIYANELIMQKAVLVKKINDFCLCRFIRDIRITVKKR
jgi:predicted nucleic acid-binding Zn ribbon protein